MGNRSSKKLSSHEQVLLELKLQRDTFVKYQRKLDFLVDKDKQSLKLLLREHHEGDRRSNQKLGLLLRKIQYQKSQLSSVEDWIANFEQMVLEAAH